MRGHVSLEKAPEARRVVEAAFGDTLFVDKVEDVTDEMVQAWPEDSPKSD